MNKITIIRIDPIKVSVFVSIVTFSISVLLSVIGILKLIFDLQTITVSFGGFVSFSNPGLILMLIYPIANSVIGYVATLITVYFVNIFLKLSNGIEFENSYKSTAQQGDAPEPASPAR